MKFSESWLREWVNPSVSREELSHQITMAGLEVDGVEPVAADFSGVIVGEVVECGQHPDADKLRVTKINVGGEELIDIVCGAANCRLGLKVAVAMVGAVLPGDFKIKKAKLRGQPSFGMLCSFGELGVDIESDGIIELPLDAPVGQDVREYLDLNDAVIDVDLTANRADCLGMAGLAREVGVLNRQAVTEPTWEAVSATIADEVSIDVQEPQECGRYLGRVIKNVNVKAETWGACSGAAFPAACQAGGRGSSTASAWGVISLCRLPSIEKGRGPPPTSCRLPPTTGASRRES